MSNTIELHNSKKCAGILTLAAHLDHEICLRGEHDLRIYLPKRGINQDLLETIKTNKQKLVAYLTKQKIAQHYGLTVANLQEAAGEDWQEISSDFDQLASFADLVSRQTLLDRQCVPKDYATLIRCRACGVVPGESGEVGRIVLGCPWCHVPNKRNRYLLNQWAKNQYNITLNDMKSGGLRRPWKEILASPALLKQLAIETQKIKQFSSRSLYPSGREQRLTTFKDQAR